MKGKIKNKIALVTGASRGLGRSISKSLAKEGAELILVGRTISALEELDDEVKSMGSKSTIVPMDLEDNEAIDILGSEINKKWGKLDILISNAGIVGEITPFYESVHFEHMYLLFLKNQILLRHHITNIIKTTERYLFSRCPSNSRHAHNSTIISTH